MAKRLIQFTQEQMEYLLKNKHVEDISVNTIKFTTEFKQLALELNKKGISPKQIFKDAGFDMNIIGKNMPQQCLGNWKHKAKIDSKTNTKYLAKQSKTNKILKDILEDNRYLKAENEFLKSYKLCRNLQSKTKY